MNNVAFGTLVTLILLFNFRILIGDELPPAGSTYGKWLKDLKNVIELKMESPLYYVQKYQGVKNLHHLIFSTSAREFFGPNRAIEKVILLNKKALGNSHEDLHKPVGNTLLYHFNGEANQYLINRLPHFAELHVEIIQLKQDIKQLLPQALFERFREGLPHPLTDDNQEYVKSLRAFKAFLNKTSFLNTLLTFDHIQIVDGYPLFSDETYFRTWKVDNKNWLGLVIGRDWSRESSDIIILEEMLEIVAVKGFNEGVFYLHDFETNNLKVALSTLNRFLTPQNTLFLQNKKVKGFYLTSDYTRDQELFHLGMLHVGITRKSILEIIELVFY